MKRFFTHAGTKIGRFFWSWGFLKFVLWAVTLIIFLYVEEDWRGARAWTATKAEWEAKGESFDLNKFIPPPVPDDENLAAIPLFKLEPNPSDKDKTTLYLIALKRAMRSEQGPGNDLPPRGNWMRGELPDMEKMRFAIAANYAAAFKGLTPPQDAIDQFNALYPFLTDLRAAAATRPLCRFNVDYTISPPDSRSLGDLVDQIKLSQILTFHAILALNHHQPDLALEDIKINYKLASGAKRDPSLVGGLVAIGINAMTHGAIFDGLAHHAWSDAQLVEIDDMLKPINFLVDYQFAMRSEAAESIANIEYYKHARQSDIYGLFGGSEDAPLIVRFSPPWASGWWDQNKCRMADSILRELATVDPRSHRAFPKVNLDLRNQIEQATARLDAFAPWNLWANLALGPMSSVTTQYSYGQVWIDEMRIACALERYRLAHGVYPGSLDALTPTYIDALPHDVVNGEPYHYRLRPDGTFLLYSVGWNQTDDGGKIVYEKDNPNRIDKTQGDWVWPTPQLSPAKSP